MILDVTAGNRCIWHRNRNPEGVIFIDKEHDLQYPPDIIADNRALPIRLGLKLLSIIFDPPWGINMPPWFLGKKPFKGKRNWGYTSTYYGDYKTKRELLTYIHQAQEELKRYTKRLCFKWGERNVPLWKILPFFKDWVEINRIEHNSTLHRSSTYNALSRNQTYWVTFNRGEVSESE